MKNKMKKFVVVMKKLEINEIDVETEGRICSAELSPEEAATFGEDLVFDSEENALICVINSLSQQLTKASDRLQEIIEEIKKGE